MATAKRSANSASEAAVRSPEVIERLCRDTASAIDLYGQVKQAHWTVTGMNFIGVHELFDAQAMILSGHVDTLAERVRALGGVPSGTARQVASLSTLDDLPVRELPSSEAIAEIAARYQAFGEGLLESAGMASQAGDIATEDVYIEVIRSLDKQQWFLRSHLE